jgi:DNA transformation protein and related proteins
MKVSPAYRDFVLEQLRHATPVTAKSMFGGVGIYAEDGFFAVIADDRLYFKVDATNRPDFESEGMQPFTPYPDRNVTMSYYEVPVSVLEDVDQLRAWARRSIAVARRAKSSS